MVSRKRSRKAAEEALAAVEPTITLGAGLETELVQGLAVLWRGGRLCDVTIVVQERGFRAHRVILAAISEPMRALFESGLSDGNSPSVKLDELDANVFEPLLEHCYTGVCSFPESLLSPVMQAAARLQL